MATWCTAADVLTYTGATVTDTTVAQAGAMIDVAANRPYDVYVTNIPAGQTSLISDTDLYWLKLACAYQAAWLPAQYDAFTRSDVAAIGRGSNSLQLKDGALVLAPLAKQTLRRVSFLKSRSVHVPGPMELDLPWLVEDGVGWQFLGEIG